MNDDLPERYFFAWVVCGVGIGLGFALLGIVEMIRALQ